MRQEDFPAIPPEAFTFSPELATHNRKAGFHGERERFYAQVDRPSRALMLWPGKRLFSPLALQPDGLDLEWELFGFTASRINKNIFGPVEEGSTTTTSGRRAGSPSRSATSAAPSASPCAASLN